MQNKITVYGKRGGDFDAYIYNVLTDLKIYFPVMPKSISESVSANFTQQDIVGASRPRIVYTSTSAKTMSLSLQNLTEDYVANGFSDLLQYIRALQALAYPMYSASGIVSSPDLRLVLGDRTMSCVCTSVNVSWGELTRENRIMTASVDLQLLMTRPGVPGVTDIQNSG